MSSSILYPKSLASLYKQCMFILVLVMATITCTMAQSPVITYPVPAQDIDRATGSSLLTIHVAFPAACNGTTVQLKFPATVSYVPGSVIKTSGTGAVITIAESNISNLNKPIFSFSGTVSPGDITFTVNRKAGCGAAATGKDTVVVSGSCGTTTENSAINNTYNFLSQSLGLVQPPAINNAANYTNYTRTATITNGGLGAADTIRFYMIYPAAGVQLLGNTLTVNGFSFSPWRTNGDTLFFKFYGLALGADKLLTNGESLTITENMRLKTCGTTTTYAAYWGPDQNTTCTLVSAQSLVTMAPINITFNSSVSQVQVPNFCREGIADFTFTNTSSNAVPVANTLFNAQYRVSFIPGSTILKPDSVKLAGQPANLPLSGAGQFYPGTNNFFTSDPDGAGIGLDDVDGDGFYDDLPPGHSVTFRWYYTQICSNTCGRTFNGVLPSLINYADMCGGGGLSGVMAASPVTMSLVNPVFTRTAPPSIAVGVPFTLQYAYNALGAGFSYHPTDSLYLQLTLPPGLTLAGTGNVTINGIAIPLSDVIQNGNTLLIRNKGGITIVRSYSLDLVYNTAAPCPIPDLVIPSSIYYVQDNTCSCIEQVICNNFQPIVVGCMITCTTGISNTSVVTKRTTLGWTNNSMTTKVAAPTGAAAYTVLPKDSIRTTTLATENATYNNLLYSFEISKTPSGQDALTYAGGLLTVTPAAGPVITCPMGIPVNNSNGSTQILRWDLTGCLPGGMINPGDKVQVDLDMVVTTAGVDTLFGIQPTNAPFANSYFSNMNGALEEICGQKQVPSIIFMGVTKNFSVPAINALCAFSDNVLGTLYNYSRIVQDAFPNEYRPVYVLDSAVYTVPPGWNFLPGSQGYGYAAWASPVAYPFTLTPVGAPVISGNKVSFINPKNGTWVAPETGTVSSSQNLILYGQFTPTSCSATPASLSLNWYYKDYAYVPAQATSKTISTSTTIGFTGKPTYALVNNSNVVAGIKQQHYWDIEIRNINTAYEWLSIEPAFSGSGISIDSVVLKPSNTLLPAAGSYAVGTGTATWYKVTPVTVGSIQQVRIYFKFSNCNADSVLVKSNWECSGYPSPNPSASCANASLYLKVIPEVSQVQAAISRQPTPGGINLCTNDSVTVVINSAQSAYVINPVLKIFPTANLNIVPSFDIEYPLGSGNWQTVAVAPVGGVYNLPLNSHPALSTLGGLPGTYDHPLLTDRQAKVKITYQAQCGFPSGENIDFQITGAQPCGVPALGNGVLLSTNSIDILGANVTGSAGMNNNLSAATIFCGQKATVTANITPLTTVTSFTDTVVYTLPLGLVYGGNFTDLSGSGTTVTTVINGTSTLVKVKIPGNIAAGTMINYSFDVSDATGLSCGNLPISGSYQRSSSALSCGGVPCSTGSTTALNTTSNVITIAKPDLTLTNVTIGGGLCQPGTACTISFMLTNSGTANAAAGTLAEIYCASSATPFTTVSLPALAMGANIFLNYPVTIPASCPTGVALNVRIRPVVDPAVGGGTNCVCNDRQGTSFVVLPVKLVNLTASLANCTATISWQTLEEINTDHFDIEYSNDGIHYETAGNTPAAGNSTVMHSYQFSMPVKDGITYFRLKEVDINGRATYSKSLTVTSHCNQHFSVLLYPNPLKSEALAKVAVNGTGKIKVMVFGAAGQMVLNRPSFVINGISRTIEINTQDWSVGLYIVKVINENTREEKIIKLVKE